MLTYGTIAVFHFVISCSHRLFCVRATAQKDVIKGNSNGLCFLTEAQASAKDSVTMSTNTFPVTIWDDHTLTAVKEFYANKNGDQQNQLRRNQVCISLSSKFRDASDDKVCPRRTLVPPSDIIWRTSKGEPSAAIPQPRNELKTIRLLAAWRKSRNN
jgi:hypothetical protein